MTQRLTRTAVALSVGIVHLGLGAFFRAHGAVYVEEAVEKSGGDWGILGVSLQSATTRDQLMPQGGTYTALELGPAGELAHPVQIVQSVLVAPENPEAVLAAMADPEGRFPSSMVDRIVPATKPVDIARVASLIGAEDAAPVIHEPFRQWVIEDSFVDDIRPDLAGVGVQMVCSVTEFEHMKLRMLNGTHSSLAYLGYLAGHETIADCMADPLFEAYVQRLWAGEIIPAVDAPEGVNLSHYASDLRNRYANASIRHRTWQIAMDGSQKLPQRILGTLAANFAAGRPSPGLVLAVAAWMIYVGGIDLAGQPIEVKDPLANELAKRAGSDDPVGALLALRDVFPEELAQALEAPLREAHAALRSVGVRAAVETVL